MAVQRCKMEFWFGLWRNNVFALQQSIPASGAEVDISLIAILFRHARFFPNITLRYCIAGSTGPYHVVCHATLPVVPRYHYIGKISRSLPPIANFLKYKRTAQHTKLPPPNPNWSETNYRNFGAPFKATWPSISRKKSSESTSPLLG